MEQFPHLKFIQKITGKPRLFGGGGPNPKTEKNKADRQGHATLLIQKTEKIKDDWEQSVATRKEDKLAPLSENIVPVFLQINPSLINYEFDLQSLGIEIISQEDDGFIIGASFDALQSLEEKINGFIKEKHGTGLIADLWQIIDGNRDQWKTERILSEGLFQNWKDIRDNDRYELEVSIAFDKPLKKEPDPNKRGGEKRLQEYRELQIERDDKLIEREDHFTAFINEYGSITSDLVHLEDSFACGVEISGKGLKDLVFNYPYVFEVSERERLEDIDISESEGDDIELQLLAPEKDSFEIGVIDSGMMEDHKYISPAIKTANSKSYLPGINSTADYVKGGGHGTRVAGAILYPLGITNLNLPYQLPFYIRNLRILDDNCGMIHKFPAELMRDVVDGNEDCKIFNLSVSSIIPFRKKHMSTWAAMIDSIIHGKNILFVISAGNITKDAIRYYLHNGNAYPEYLQEPFCKIANPAQSSFALTVGSMNHTNFADQNWTSLGNEHDVSAFSRIGLGIWDEIKPDVVEFGGGLVSTNSGGALVKQNEQMAPELLRSTMHGGNFKGRDQVGTSYSAPKVTHMVAQLKKLYPTENVNLLRALVVQGARLPNVHFTSPKIISLQHFGYGLPSFDRVTKNNEQRITFYNTSEIKAEEGHTYLLTIPDDLRNPGDEYEVLIEITLAFTAKVRRTRQQMKSYLSTWLDWETSKIDEPFNNFKDYILKEIEGTETEYDKDKRKQYDSFSWMIGNRSNRGEIENINRTNSTLQKDWAFLKSYQLPKEIGIAVAAHKGWDKSAEEIPYAIVVSIEVLNNKIPIYESIRIENEIEIPIT